MNPNLTDQNFQFPPNIIEGIPVQQQQNLMTYLISHYVFPYILERRPYEPLWDKLAMMYRVKFKINDMRVNKDSGISLIQRLIETVGKPPDMANVADTVVYDAVDRQKNLAQFIAWKDGTPVQFQFARNYQSYQESPFYKPIADKIKAANALIDWNNRKHNVYLMDLVARWHYYLYGVSFINSEFKYIAEQDPVTGMPVVQEFGTTFTPISLRNLWIDYRVNSWNFQYQPCPFYYEVMPRYSLMDNIYDPTFRPFGYANLEKLAAQNPQWLFMGDEATNAFKRVLQDRLSQEGRSENVTNIVSPENGQEALWTLYPTLQWNPETMQIDATMPPKRFIINIFSSSILNGNATIIRMQEYFYPKDCGPLYASALMPDLDSGAYGLSFGEILENHYSELCTIMNQYIDNKNRINNPPSKHMVGDPSIDKDVNGAGAKVIVNSPNGFEWATVPDATQTTIGAAAYVRDQAQTTSKSTDAILGKAMGSRTSATEASNIFQTSMSGITTDVNIYGNQILGGYGMRVYKYARKWGDPQVLQKIAGIVFEPISDEELMFQVEMQTDTGSQFIESVVRQQNLRYAIEGGMNSPALRQDLLWKALGKEMKMPELVAAVNDGDFEFQVGRANQQATETYLGMPVIIAPNQNHEVAIRVKTQYLEDRNSQWNQQYGGQVYPMPNPKTGQQMTCAEYLGIQIQLHQEILQMQMQQQMLQQQAMVEQQHAQQMELKQKPQETLQR
jgi:hypothetical protein